MMKWIYYAIIAYLVYSAWKFIRGIQRRSVDPRRKNPPRLSGMMVKDETCDTYIPKEEAIHLAADGREYYFCSKECREKFLTARKRR
jgi:YHS domain-containing protein